MISSSPILRLLALAAARQLPSHGYPGPAVRGGPGGIPFDSNAFPGLTRNHPGGPIPIPGQPVEGIAEQLPPNPAEQIAALIQPSPAERIGELIRSQPQEQPGSLGHFFPVEPPDVLGHHPLPHEPEQLAHNPTLRRRRQGMSPLASRAAGY